jgi:hypothetical protein
MRLVILLTHAFHRAGACLRNTHESAFDRRFAEQRAVVGLKRDEEGIRADIVIVGHEGEGGSVQGQPAQFWIRKRGCCLRGGGSH